MKFSIIMPTRGDEKNVEKLLDSIERNTRDKKSIEVLFAIDEGERSIINFVDGKKYSFRVEFFERPKTDNFSKDYYNWLANKSCGENIWVLNDDAWIITNDWDAIILKKIKEHRWDTYLVDTHDSTKINPGNYFCTFPMISRKACGLLGYTLHPRVRIFPADKVAFDTFKAIDRIIDANEILIQHDHIVEADKSKSKMMKIFEEDKEIWAKEPIDLRNDIVRLLKYAGQNYKESKLTRIIKILQEV